MRELEKRLALELAGGSRMHPLGYPLDSGLALFGVVQQRAWGVEQALEVAEEAFGVVSGWGGQLPPSCVWLQT